MAALVKEAVKFYKTSMTDNIDPRTKDLPFVGSPLPAAAVLLAYYVFVTKLGPRLMRDRKPFKLNGVIQVYNLCQVAVCGSLAFKGFTKYFGPWGQYSWYCHPVQMDTSEETMDLIRLGYVYFILKFADLLDTVFFVLRKKQSHVTFLHIYHHMVMVFIVWFGITFIPGGHAAYMPVINSLVHSVMYGYYFLSSIYKNNKYVQRFKKYVTTLQLIQFLSLCAQGVAHAVLAPDCNFPILVVLFCYPQNLFMVVMFADFYYKHYIRPIKANKIE